MYRNYRGLGELPEDRRFESSVRGKRILSPGEGYLSDWINRYTQSNFPFTIGIVSKQIIPSNPLRTYLLIQNKSASSIYVNFGTDATPYNGIIITAGGNYIFEGGSNGGSFCPGDSVNVVGSAANLIGVVSEGLITAYAE